jgi:acetolactate synthase-1/2/3 large subunit
MERYADQFMGWLQEMGYSHCFFLAGGGSMHLLDAASKIFRCIPVVHEVTAVISSEYFNESNRSGKKAFALVTTGPGLTNSITGIAGAWLESRECLIVGGQVKRDDLAPDGLRQKGIQEVNGIGLVKSITKASLRISKPVTREIIQQVITEGATERKGPVFIEFCIDASASPASELMEKANSKEGGSVTYPISNWQLSELRSLIMNSKRPLVLLGAGVSQAEILRLEPQLEKLGIPLASTWTGADRANSEYKYYAGRPNTYGMRWANIFQQQSDLLIAIGTRLNLQQTGFNCEDFMPVGSIVHVDIDPNELNKPNPKDRLAIRSTSTEFLTLLIEEFSSAKTLTSREEWLEFLDLVKREVPIIEEFHKNTSDYVNPHVLINLISKNSSKNDIVVTCSSGGTFTATHQSFQNSRGQQIISNKGLASMGYGLAGAIGAAIANPDSRILLFEGDGGFAQNLQDLGTVKSNNLNLKMFIFSNSGYASIRSSQISYFSGNYVGCDVKTGLGLPNWSDICNAYGIEYQRITPEDFVAFHFMHSLDGKKPIFFEVMTDPNLLYTPKVASKILPSGQMSSAAIHDMSPKISPELAAQVFKYLPRELWGQ